MPKDWKELTVDEKVDVLRIDLDNITTDVDDLKRQVTNDRATLGNAVRRLVASVTEVRKRLNLK